MAKYSYEFKLQVVRDYLQGLGGYRALAKRYAIAHKDVACWVRLQQAHGFDSLKRRYHQHSVSFKLEVLKRMATEAWSVQKTAAFFNIAAPSTVRTWRALYNQGGVDFLQPQPKGRRPMPKRTDYKALLSKPIAGLTHAELLQRLEYLEAENAYLKKLEALAQQKNLVSKRKSK
jgi:transposase